MTDLQDGLRKLAEWHQAQQAFWAQAMQSPAAEAIQDFMPTDWPIPDDLLDHLLAGFEPQTKAGTPQGDWLAVLRAAQAYRKLIHQTWRNVQQDFEAHRIAITAPTSPIPDWRELRDRWLAIAETAFIRLQRRPDFIATQRDLLAAFCTWYLGQDAAVKTAVLTSRQARALAQKTALNITAVPIAQTPKHLIWQQGKTSVHRYAPLRKDAPTLGPVLICYGLIGRQTMTDLLPQRSLVRNLLAMGVDVFVIDWGAAGPEDATRDLDHYAVDLLTPAINAALQASARESLTLMGICQGGTLALCHAALPAPRLNGLICAGTPVDFHADEHDANPAHGLLNLWMRGLSAADVDALIAMDNVLSGEFLGAMFNQLNPIRTLGRYLVDLPAALADPTALNTFMAMETWLADRPDLPAAFARTWLKDLYQDNLLVKGKLTLQGHPIDLSNITTPVLNITASSDHIIPPQCSTALAAHLPATQYSQLSVPAGHIGTFVGRQAQTLTAPGIVDWLRENT